MKHVDLKPVSRFSVWLFRYFLKTFVSHFSYPVQKCEVLLTVPLAGQSFVKIVDRSHVMPDVITSMVFKIKNLKKKVARKHSHRNGKMIGVKLLSYSMKEIMKMYSDFSFPIKSIGKLWTIWVSWWAEKSWIVHNFPMDLRKNPTIHLHYFIHRKRQMCQSYHFPFLRESFFCQSFPWHFWMWKTVDVMTTWLLSMTFMKDSQGERLGKISHSSVQVVEGVKAKVFRKYLISHMRNR